MPVSFSIRRSAQPGWPSAVTCFFFSSFKTLLTLTEAIRDLIEERTQQHNQEPNQ
jgi:hypothetical protein